MRGANIRNSSSRILDLWKIRRDQRPVGITPIRQQITFGCAEPLDYNWRCGRPVACQRVDRRRAGIRPGFYEILEPGSRPEIDIRDHLAQRERTISSGVGICSAIPAARRVRPDVSFCQCHRLALMSVHVPFRNHIPPTRFIEPGLYRLNRSDQIVDITARADRPTIGR